MNHKRVIYNQILVDKFQLQHITAFLTVALKHRRKIPRRFRIIIEELHPEPVDSEAP